MGKTVKKSQAKKFINEAREIGCNDPTNNLVSWLKHPLNTHTAW